MLKKHSKQEVSIEGWKEASVTGFTLLRMGQSHIMARKVRQRKPIVKDMALFVAWDIADGVVARLLHADSPRRRVIDAVVDRIAVAENLFAISTTNKRTRPYTVLLAARELVVGIANARHYADTQEVVQGTGLHKLASLSLAGYGVVAAQHEEYTDLAGTLMVGLMAVTAAEYIQNSFE